MPRYKKAESQQMKEEARRQLLVAALAEFAAQGYAGANINRISEAAGCAQGTVYNYFASKRDLFAAVIGDVAERHCALVLQAMASAPQPAARLERLLTAGFAFAQGLPEAAQVIAAALYGADAEIRATVYRAHEPLWRYVEEEIVRAGLLEQRFRSLDARVVAATILAVYLGGCAGGGEGEQLRANPRAVAALLLDGLRARA